MNPLSWIGAGVAIFIAGYIGGHVAAGASAERAALRARAIAAEAQAADVTRLRAENESLRSAGRDLEQKFAARPVPQCRFADDELRRLRAIIARRPAAAR